MARRTSRSWPRLIEAVGATLFAAVPSLFRQMLKYCDFDNDRLATLRHGLAAGEALSPALLEDWRATTGKELYEAFGMSECSTFISNRAGMPVRPGSPGKPQRGRRVTVLPLSGEGEHVPPGEVGLLAIHREEPGLMLGYWRRPDEEQRVIPRRLVRRRRPRGLRCGRLCLVPRTCRRHDECGRLPRVAARSRRSACGLSRHRRNRRRRAARARGCQHRRRLCRPAGWLRGQRRATSWRSPSNAWRPTNGRSRYFSCRACRAAPTASCCAAISRCLRSTLLRAR